MSRLFSVTKFGQWGAAFEMINRFRTKFAKASNRALSIEAERYARAMKIGILRGAPGGRKFQPLEDITVFLKGSIRPLVHRNDLANSCRSKKVFPGIYFAGIARNEVSSQGKWLQGIGEVHEFGAIIFQKVTKKQTKFYGFLVRAGKMKYVPRVGSIVVIRIQKRPFVEPVWKKLGPSSPDRIYRNTMKALGVAVGPAKK